MVVFLAAAAPIFAAGNDTQKAKKIKKILVVYYSATGTTERLANIIAKEMKADIFVLKPKQPYTSADLNWSNKNSRVVKEHEKGAANVSVELETAKIPNFESYDTVFIGYPIWWGDLPPVVYTFIEEHDMDGKMIIPFCTHEGSGMAGTARVFRRMFKHSTVNSGISILGHIAQNDRHKADIAVTTWLKLTLRFIQ